MNTFLEKTEILIENVKQNPALYNPDFPEYRNKVYKNNIWEEIALKTGDKTAFGVKTKWRNLRDCYGKYLKVNYGQCSVHSQSRRYKSWPWAQHMSFLEPFYEGAALYPPTTKFIQEPIEIEFEDMSQSDSQHQTETISRKRMRDQNIYPLDKVVDCLHSRPATEYDDIDLLFLGYARTLKKLSPHRQVVVKYKLAKLFMEAETEHLQEIEQYENEHGVEIDSPNEESNSPNYTEVKLEPSENENGEETP